MQRPALLLVDLQHDFLERPGLVPDAATLSERAAAVLRRWRALGLPVAHAQTVVDADGTDGMPHWRRDGVRRCVAGTRGAAAPPALAPAADELVLRKRFYSAFADPRLEHWLRAHAVTDLVLAGNYLHACVRSTALDGYERGFAVTILDDVVGTTEPAHAEATRRWLGTRAAELRPAADVLAAVEPPRAAEMVAEADMPVSVIAGVRHAGDGLRAHFHRDPCRTARVLTRVPLGGAAEVAAATRTAAAARRDDRAEPAERAARLERWADDLEANRARFVDLLVREVAKPRRAAEEEAGRAVAHARLAAELARGAAPATVAPGVTVATCAVGVLGLLTPWNNPLAIPVGKIAPALAFGNAVVLKPAPQAAATALALAESLARAGVPPGLVNVVWGGADAARALCREPGIAAVSVTGSLATGCVVAALCAERLLPLQAELGGNNAAIVLRDADLDRVATDLAAAAFGFAGQRCTAIRRVVVERAVAAALEQRLVAAIARLVIGDPAAAATDVGPLITAEKRDQLLALLADARRAGARIVTGGGVPPGCDDGAWLAPTLVADAHPASPLVQEESFGPIAVLQIARDLDEALARANGVPQGLVMALHGGDPPARARVLAAAEAGIVQLAPAPLAIHPRAPFSGWKASGLGPPEHGIWDAAFYARVQARYGDAE